MWRTTTAIAHALPCMIKDDERLRAAECPKLLDASPDDATASTASS